MIFKRYQRKKAQKILLEGKRDFHENLDQRKFPAIWWVLELHRLEAQLQAVVHPIKFVSSAKKKGGDLMRKHGHAFLDKVKTI